MSDRGRNAARHGAAGRPWWQVFNDPALDQIVAEAQRSNPSVAHRRRAHHGSARATRHRRQRPLSAAAATERPGVAGRAGHVGRTELLVRQPTAPRSTSPGKWTSGASSGAASRRRTRAISPASRSTTTCRCWSRRRPPASTRPSAPSSCGCESRTRTPRCRSAASRSPNGCSRAATSPSWTCSRRSRCTSARSPPFPSWRARCARRRMR